MKIKILDIIILIVPVLIMLLLTPILPDRVPIHWSITGAANRFIDKKFAFALGIMPFVIYEAIKLKYFSK